MNGVDLGGVRTETLRPEAGPMDHSIEHKHSGMGDGLDLAPGSEHDGLMDIISQMESRLAALRDSESQRDRLQEEIRHQFDDLDERERSLRELEATLGQPGGVAADRESLESERSRIRESLDSIAKERESLRTREIEVQVLTETLRRDRELLEGRRTQLEATERELRGREQVLVTQTELIDQEALDLEARRKELAAREEAVREVEARNQAHAEEVRAREAHLAEQERELRVAQERHQAMQAEVISLNRRLADANAMAAEQARQVENARAQGQAALAEAQRHCEKLEAEAVRVRSELAKIRRSPGTAEGATPEPVAAAKRVKAKAPRFSSARSRSTALAVIWMATVAVAAMACYIGVALQQPGPAAWLLGLAFAGCFVGGMGCSNKPLDPSSLPLVLFGGTFGAWFPRLFALVANAVETWDLPLHALPASMLPQVPLAASILAAGLVISFALLFLGGSFSFMVQSVFATIAATGLALLPDPSYSALAAGALLWHGIMAAGLARWAMGSSSDVGAMDAGAVGRVLRG